SNAGKWCRFGFKGGAQPKTGRRERSGMVTLSQEITHKLGRKQLAVERGHAQRLLRLCPVVLFALIFVGIAVKSVPQGHEWTVERFGRYIRTLEPGLALIVPIVDRIGARVSMMETVLEVPSQSVITRDNAAATVDAIVFYQVLDAAKAAYEVGN